MTPSRQGRGACRPWRGGAGEGLKSKNDVHALLAELKWDNPAETALGQAKMRNYPAAFASLSGDCVLVGISHRDGADVHECHIARVTL